MYKDVSINISSFAVERSQVFFFFSYFMYKSKKPNVSSSTVRRHYNEDSEASVQSCSRHQKRNTNAMSFVHRVMNAACFCACVSACVMCVRDWGGFVRRSAKRLRVAPPRGEKTECAKPLAKKKKEKKKKPGLLTPHHVSDAADSLL